MIWLAPLAQLTAASLLLVLTTFIFLRRPSRPLWPDLLVLQLLQLSFVIGDVLTFYATEMLQKEIGLFFVYLGAIGGPAWLLRVALAMLLQSSPQLQWPHTVRKGVLIWAVCAGAFALTNPLHGAFLTPILGSRNLYTPAWWAISAVSWALMLSSTAAFTLLLRLTRSGPSRQYKDTSNATLLLIASLLPILGNLAWITIPGLPFDPSATGLALASLLVTWGIYQTGMFDILPMGFRAVLDNDPDAIFLAAGNRRIGYANPAATIMLAETTMIADPYSFTVDQVFDLLFAKPTQMQSLFPDGLSRTRATTAFTARDQSGRRLRIETFTVKTGRGPQIVAIRLRDMTLDEARRRNRSTAMRRIEQDLSAHLQPAIEAADRALVMMSRASSAEQPLKEHLRTVRATLSDLNQGVETTLQLHLVGKSSHEAATEEEHQRSAKIPELANQHPSV